MNYKIRTINAADLDAALDRTRRHGKDPGEALDRAGVLLTSSRLEMIRADTLDNLADMLEGSDLSEWRGDMSIRSPQDAKNAITARIRLLAKATRVRSQR